MFLRQHAPGGQPAIPSEDDEIPPMPAPQPRPAAVAVAAGPRMAEPAPSAPERPDASAVPPHHQQQPAAWPAGAGRAPAAAEQGNGKRLIVGDGIRLKGEITACDRLIVEGHVEVTLNDTRTLEIKPTGCFIGSCEVEEAEISGTYEGDLTVRGQLVIRSSGRIAGRIRYGELELERGGQIAGELSVRAHAEESGAAARGGDAPRRTGAAAA
jgi:cytoskeletal protein CcmA (bactofilin family)